MSPVQYVRRTARPAVACLTALSLSLAVSGCAQRADGTTVTAFDDIRVMRMNSEGLTPPAARQLDRAQRYAEMRLTGATLGLLAGAAAGALAIRNNRGAGAAGGAVLGAALGYLGGAYVANLNSQAEDRRTNLNVQLAAANRAVAESREAVSDARAIASQQRRELDRVMSAYRAGQVSRDQAAAQVKTSKDHLALIDEAIRAVQDNIQGINVTINDNQKNGRSSQGLSSRVSELRQQESQLQAQRQRLLEAFRGVPADLDPPATA